MNETWLSTEYNLLPALKQLRMTTLILHGDHDLECPNQVHKENKEFLHVH